MVKQKTQKHFFDAAGEKTMTYIKRHMEELILKLSEAFPVILVTGPRQAGKTTLLRHLSEEEGKGRAYVTLDDLNERKLAKTDPALFIQTHQPPVLIDEVQYAPEIFTYIKIYADEHHRAGDFWLTGSQVFHLMRGVQESMAGRAALLHLSPLSQREIAGASCVPFTTDPSALKGSISQMQPVNVGGIYERIWEGCMPGIVNNPQVRDTLYSSYLMTYIERDVREISGTVNSLKFLDFITAAAARCSQVLNIHSLAEDADIDQVTAKNWLNILETLGIIFLLHPYSNNVLKRTIKSPKLYFYDTGLVCYLTKWSSAQTAQSGAMNGALLEDYAVSEIVKGYQNAGQEPYIYYYRDRDAKEIDLIIEKDQALYPIEIKKTASPTNKMTRTFSLLDKPPMKRGTGAILCMHDGLTALDRETLIVPIWAI